VSLSIHEGLLEKRSMNLSVIYILILRKIVFAVLVLSFNVCFHNDCQNFIRPASLAGLHMAVPAMKKKRFQSIVMYF